MTTEHGSISLSRVTKRFGNVAAVDDLSLDIHAGEFLSLLGPSGCGKTTTLRMLAGFEEPDEGSIAISGTSVVGVPPYRRDVNTVFQQYALFPHMTVAENVAYGLRQKGVSRAEIAKRVSETLAMVKMTALADRRPRQMSGGQQQRVALARALVNRPSVLLLDEPLAALDRKLRQEMQVELKLLQREVGITFVFVTHDQEEALSMSDRIAIMRDGSIEQLGTPDDVYERPVSAFVAGFIGQNNFWNGVADGATGAVHSVDGVLFGCGSNRVHGDALIAVRPEAITLLEGQHDGTDSVIGRVVGVSHLGDVIQFVIRTAGPDVLARIARRQAPRLQPGDDVTCSWPASAGYVFPADSGGTTPQRPTVTAATQRTR